MISRPYRRPTHCLHVLPEINTEVLSYEIKYFRNYYFRKYILYNYYNVVHVYYLGTTINNKYKLLLRYICTVQYVYVRTKVPCLLGRIAYQLII